MKIFVINSGSSSLKFQLLESEKNFQVLCKGVVDGIGLPTCQFILNGTPKVSVTQNIQCNDHHKALEIALHAMVKQKILRSLNEISAIGHRVVHGGEKYHSAVKITAPVIKTIDALKDLAPLHNPHNLKGILACKKLLKHVPQAAVFDTSFHETLPAKAYLYALPYELYTKDQIRRYGFHGTSHQYVSRIAIKMLGEKSSKIVSCHLGNGSSVTAIENGKSLDTSMGFTPLEGLPMGTRSGDIDPAIIFQLLRIHHKKPQNIERMLLNESGLKGMSGVSSDMRALEAAAKKKNKRVLLTLQILAYRIAKYIGSYAAAMNGLDAIIFTAGIGENAAFLRKDVCSYLTYLGVQINESKNKKNTLDISAPKSKIKIFVIPTNEEREIAEETIKVLKK